GGSAEVHHAFEITHWCCRSNSTEWRRYRVLPARHSVIEIIGHQQRDVDVTACHIQQMSAAYPTAAIPLQDDDSKFRTRKLQATRIGYRTTVEAMKAVCGEVSIGQPNTTDIGHNNSLGRIRLQFNKRFVQRFEQRVMSTSGTER
ncbi:MAG: hypothetical protein V1243_04485, partial [Arenicellales bacterium]|nr:hypothetical protein [Arenicellales bacterium]